MAPKEVAQLRGHHMAVELAGGQHSLTGWVAPEPDLDARFPMTCGDTGDLLQVDGWMFELL